MNQPLRNDADKIISASLKAVLPDSAVQRALKSYQPRGGKTLLVGVVVTKYDHVMGQIPGVDCYEGGHPVPDEGSFSATGHALELVRGLKPEDTVLFLLSGGGSALFEQPLVSGEELQDITRQLLACGTGVQHRPERYPGRPARHDRQRPRLPGRFHL